MAELNLSRQVVQDAPKVLEISISGELDEHNGRKAEGYFDDSIIAEKPRHVLLDLSGLAFAGTSFFSSLLFWKEETAKAGGQLVLFGLQPQVASTMRILALDRMMAICDTRQAALDKLPKD
jgi:anti-anti-sigma factor